MKKIIKQHPAWFIFFTVLSLRLTAIAIARLLNQHPTPLEYEVIATNWLNGKGFTYFHLGTVYRSFPNPLYPFLSIAIYKIFGHYQLLLAIAHSLFSGLLSVCIYRIGCFIDKRTGMIAALLTMIHPGIFYYDLFYLHGLSMDSFLFTFIILMFMRLRVAPTLLNQVGSGVALGLQMYERGTIIFFVIPALIWLYYFQEYKETVTGWLKKCVLILIVMGLLIAPWTIRNFMIHKEFVMITTAIYEVLWRGNNPLATGTAYSKDGKPMFFSTDKKFQDRIMGLDELGQMHAFKEEAWQFIEESYSRFIHLTLKKMVLFWWFSPLTGIEYKFSYLGVVKIVYTILVLLTIWGIALTIKDKSRIGLVVLIVILFFTITLGQSFFYVQQKHRWALEPLVFIFVAYFLLYLYNWIKAEFKNH